ncbi:hypothetical protein BDW60DRAFT_94111 [Aspergillus nidulans var. acristatus]
MRGIRGYRVQSEFSKHPSPSDAGAAFVILHPLSRQADQFQVFHAVVLRDQYRKIDPSLPWHKAHASTQPFPHFRRQGSAVSVESLDSSRLPLGSSGGLVTEYYMQVMRKRLGVQPPRLSEVSDMNDMHIQQRAGLVRVTGTDLTTSSVAS